MRPRLSHIDACSDTRDRGCSAHPRDRCPADSPDETGIVWPEGTMIPPGSSFLDKTEPHRPRSESIRAIEDLPPDFFLETLRLYRRPSTPRHIEFARPWSS